MTVETLSAFFLASVLLALAPGPDNLFVLAQSLVQGRLAGVVITLGLCTGLIVHTAAVVLGVAVLIQTSALAFTMLKLLGAAYLLYLAWGAFQAAGKVLAGEKRDVLPLARLYGRGIIMNVTNPKVTIFFLAFLPQFVDPESGDTALQILLLGALFMLAALIVFVAIAALAGSYGQTLTSSPRAQVILNRIAGVVFLGLAVRLIWSQ